MLPNCQLMTGGDPKDHLNSYLNSACVSTTPLLTAGSTITGLTPYQSPDSQTYTIDTGGGRLQGPVTRGFFRQPFQKRWDVTASKKFTLPKLGEQTNLEFRARVLQDFQ